jgi:hypothetical protein
LPKRAVEKFPKKIAKIVEARDGGELVSPFVFGFVYKP